MKVCNTSYKKIISVATIAIFSILVSGCDDSSSGSITVNAAPVAVRDVSGVVHYLSTGKLKFSSKGKNQFEFSTQNEKFRVQSNKKISGWNFELKGSDIGQDFDLFSSKRYEQIATGRRYNSSSGTKSYCTVTENTKCDCTYEWLEDYTKYRVSSNVYFKRGDVVLAVFKGSLPTEEDTTTISGSETNNCGL